MAACQLLRVGFSPGDLLTVNPGRPHLLVQKEVFCVRFAWLETIQVKQKSGELVTVQDILVTKG